ncbi:hypothetical protein COL32_20670 [Bacillus pseudomycoides]|uniref:hypothetical protein n=1 Tax=Bacillus pseudomycoides TaxID=64104 RepID=UPI000BEF73F8|nr:hypothetical protein [Bacillus pseudomycoides]MCR8861109.1 hypothetical protein [Bacillus pseudomycoides]PEI44595.1 hypothetical protein CN641_15805 [Bacillus pseudomycoides]PFX40405.1 hypothetical protein COL32_20670 [Bacillus pseudomycoides]PFY13909.1 hypothetical protein COL42_20585 [Bacillus pseudomycoides]
MNKFEMLKNNPYGKAEGEALNKGSVSEPNKAAMNIPQGKETKKQMSLMFTQSHKDKARRIAKKHNLSVSELFGYWLDQYDEEQ